MVDRRIDVFVFGVGRSGTTMIYALLQEIVAASFDGEIRFTYEPFLWNPAVLDDRFENTELLFGRTSTLNIEGMYHHLMLPMFIETPPSIDYRKNRFFRLFCPGGAGPGSHVAKLIRANGRMRVFRALNPDARFVLVVRNPIDAVNSVKNLFSFFGDDHHPSDFSRFCDELGPRLVLDPESASWAEMQAEYSVQMTRAALQFATGDSQTLVLEYDQFVRDGDRGVRALCEHLGVDSRAAYGGKLRSPVGLRTSGIALSEAEYRATAGYEELYHELCVQYGLQRPVGSEELHARYRGKCRASSLDPRYQGATPNRLRELIREKDDAIEELKGQIDALRRRSTPSTDD